MTEDDIEYPPETLQAMGILQYKLGQPRECSKCHGSVPARKSGGWRRLCPNCGHSDKPDPIRHRTTLPKRRYDRHKEHPLDKKRALPSYRGELTWGFDAQPQGDP